MSSHDDKPIVSKYTKSLTEGAAKPEENDNNENKPSNSENTSIVQSSESKKTVSKKSPPQKPNPPHDDQHLIVNNYEPAKKRNSFDSKPKPTEPKKQPIIPRGKIPKDRKPVNLNSFSGRIDPPPAKYYPNNLKSKSEEILHDYTIDEPFEDGTDEIEAFFNRKPIKFDNNNNNNTNMFDDDILEDELIGLTTSKYDPFDPYEEEIIEIRKPLKLNEAKKQPVAILRAPLTPVVPVPVPMTPVIPVATPVPTVKQVVPVVSVKKIVPVMPVKQPMAKVIQLGPVLHRPKPTTIIPVMKAAPQPQVKVIPVTAYMRNPHQQPMFMPVTTTMTQVPYQSTTLLPVTPMHRRRPLSPLTPRRSVNTSSNKIVRFGSDPVYLNSESSDEEDKKHPPKKFLHVYQIVPVSRKKPLKSILRKPVASAGSLDVNQ